MAILLVDDEVHALNAYETHLLGEGINDFVSSTSGAEALSIIEKKDISVVLLDLRMPKMSGEEVLATINRLHPGVTVIVATAVDEVETAVRCMRMGAFDYLLKPIDQTRLLASIRKAIEYHEVRLENVSLAELYLEGKVKNPMHFSRIITNNEKMRSLFRYIESIAITSHPVLITGETGVGKELIAQSVHAASERKGQLIAINVAGLDDDTFADTLFGHKRGAFTGADRERVGLIGQATDGTLFLDEIGDLSVHSQLKFLRLLQEREYYPLGSDAPCRTNARVVAATNRDLKVAVESGSFRADLYYRLLLHRVHIPPLRERRDDIALLAKVFVKEAAEELNIKPPSIPEDILARLYSYAFQGNVRELKSLIFDSMSQREPGITPFENIRALDGQAFVSPQPVEPKPNVSMNGLYSSLDMLPTLEESEDMLIAEAMRRTNQNQTVTAELLGITRQTLHRRFKMRDKTGPTDKRS
jgi:DNA-binding NtrC family response regulator